MAEDDVSLDGFDSLVHFQLKITATHDPASILYIPQQHVQSHYRPNYYPLRSLAVLLRLNEIKPISPLIHSVHQMEVYNRKYELLLRKRIEVGIEVALVFYYLRNDRKGSLQSSLQVLGISILFTKWGITDVFSLSRTRLVVTDKSTH